MEIEHYIFISMIGFMIVGITFGISMDINEVFDKKNSVITCNEFEVPIGIANCTELSDAYLCCLNNSYSISQIKICDERYLSFILNQCKGVN